MIGRIAASLANGNRDGAFFVPKSYGTSISLTGSPLAAMFTFLAFYATCLFVTWWFYARKGAADPC